MVVIDNLILETIEKISETEIVVNVEILADEKGAIVKILSDGKEVVDESFACGDFETENLPLAFSRILCKYIDSKLTVVYIDSDNYFEISTLDVKDVFEGVDLADPETVECLQDLIEENIG